ncbi:GNAT family N-acetyltransferase [Streptomyces sp. NPDC090077]|uniref:GNAT family N-acetyltransferase n=1 Tax=Streptomyces sp. NPDC090077 TaxID=3365938 RepID=UPI0038289370
MILVLISPRQAGLPFAAWLPEEAGRLVAVTAAGADVGPGFAEVVTVPDYTCDDAVLAAARDAARRHRPRAVLALAEADVERAALLRGELGLPGLDTTAAAAYRDKVLMKEYARAAGIPVPAFAPVATVGDLTDFMAAHPGRVVVKPRGGSGSTGVHVLDAPGRAAPLAGLLADGSYEVEEFVEGVLHHVDVFRVAGEPVAAVASRYTGAGCLTHWADAPLGSRNLDRADPLHERLVAQTWRLIDALPSPETLCAHAEFFVTGDGRIVLCEVAARVGGGPIPTMLRHVLGVDPRELWARVECALPVALDRVREHARTAPLAAFCGIPPKHGRVLRLPEAPPGAQGFAVHTHLGDDWTGERYRQRKSGDFLASWILTDPDAAALDARLDDTARQVDADFGWERPQETAPYTARLLPPGHLPQSGGSAGAPDLVWDDPRWLRFTARTDLHEVRCLEVLEGERPVALATLMVTAKPGGLLFYDAPRLAGTPSPMAEPELLDPADRERWDAYTASLPEGRPDHYPSLALATFGSHHGVVHSPGRSPGQRTAVMAALPALLQRAAAELGCRSTALLYVGEPDAEAVDAAATRAGYHATLLGAEAVHQLYPDTAGVPGTDDAADRWESYVAGIGSRRRRGLRKEVGQYERDGFRTVVTTGPGAIDDTVVALQVTHRAKYGLPGGHERVRRDFDALREEIGESCVVLGAVREGRTLGFALFLRAGDSLFLRTVGFGPEAAGCYLALTYHEATRWALENGIRRIHYGLATYEAKFQRGCTLRPRWGWFAFHGPDADGYREVLALQSRSVERRLERVGSPATPVPSRLPSPATSSNPPHGAAR